MNEKHEFVPIQYRNEMSLNISLFLNLINFQRIFFLFYIALSI